MDNQTSILEQYIGTIGTNPDHVLESFNQSLADASQNTRRSYNTDVYKFLVNKLFCFWDFHQTFNPMAQHLALLHALDLTDQRISTRQLSSEQGQALLEKALSQTPTNLLPAPSKRALKPSYDLLGPSFSLSYHGDRLIMQLRPTGPAEKVVEIRKRDKLMLDFIFGNYNPNEDFWPDIFRTDKVGQVLQFQEANGNSKNTIARKMAALDRFEELLYELNLTRTRVMPSMRRPTTRRRPQVFLEDKELGKLFGYVNDVCKRPNHYDKSKLLAFRDRSMLYLLYTTLVRGNALCEAKMQDLDLDQRVLNVTEKGRKENTLPLTGPTLRYLKEYLTLRPEFLEAYHIPTQYQDFLFHTVRGMPMSRRSLSRIVDEYSKGAGIQKTFRGKKHIGSHAIRRSSAILMSKRGAPIQDLSRLMNHSTLNTTQQYLMSAPPDHSQTIKKYHPLGK